MSGGTLLPFPEESRVVRARVRASVCVCVSDEEACGCWVTGRLADSQGNR